MTEHTNKIGLIQIVAALMIINHHTGRLEIPYLGNFTGGGFVFNTIFIYLSGYLLGKSYSPKKTPGFNQFMLKRMNRIYPSLHISLIFIAIIYFTLGKTITYREAILSFTGFQYLFGITAVGEQMWFISIILLCYIVCLPSIFLLKKYPNIFFTFLTILVTIALYYKDNSLYNIYDIINNDCIYRFIYHYVIFVIALFISIRGRDVEIFSIRSAYFIFIIFFPLYLLLTINNYVNYIRVLGAALLALSIVTLISSSYPFIVKIFPPLFLLSSITYEIYLIHVSIIAIFERTSPQKFYTYPAVFILSIALAFVVSKFSDYYRQLLRNSFSYMYGCIKPIAKP